MKTRLTKCRLAAKFFVNSDSLKSLVLPAHNQALAGDTLTSIQLNYEWRKIVASALYFYFRHNGKTELAYDNDDFLSVLLEDLYTAESFGSAMKTHSQSVFLTGNPQTSSTTFVAVANSGFSFTPSHAKALVRVSNLSLISAAGNNVEAQIEASHGTRVQNGLVRVQSTSNREVDMAACFDDLPIGVEVTFNLAWKSSGGTASIGTGTGLVAEIVEYD